MCVEPMNLETQQSALEHIAQARAFYLQYVSRRVSQRADAEDIVQQAFNKAVRYIHTLRDAHAWRAWFQRIVRQCVADHYAQQQKHSTIELGLEDALLAQHDVASATPSLNLCACSHKFVHELPKDTAELVRRVSIEDETPSQAARAMGMSPNAARVRLHRAHAKIKASLNTHCTTQGDGTHYKDYLECTCVEC